MDGKKCVMTGANTGIGKSTAVALAALGAHVIMICRDESRGENARLEIAAAARKGGRGGGAELHVADLSSQAEVQRVAHEILAAHQVIDVLINNAGAVLRTRELTVDGLEQTFAVNYLAYFMLANLMLPALRAAGRSRIINVASRAHKRANIDFANLQGTRTYSSIGLYSASKLEDIMFTYALARRLEGSGVTVNALHPGVVATELWRQTAILRILSRWFMLSPEKGALTTIYLAASPEVDNVSGKYFSKCRPVDSSRASYDETVQEKLWAMSVTLTGLGSEIG
jgi:NAD(P)-dependent dehydrogenase (short-subunit alcohol dehydrogenase family)